MKSDMIINSTEEELKIYLRDVLEPSFEIKEEVNGASLIDGSKVRIDFFLFPREQLVEVGFVDEWFGIEVKAPGSLNNRVKKGLWTGWQCVTYSQSEFEGIRPVFVLMFPSMRIFFEGRESDTGAVHYLDSFLQKANVGRLEVANGKWAIRFGSSRYFSESGGLGNVKNIGLKRYIGTKK